MVFGWHVRLVSGSTLRAAVVVGFALGALGASSRAALGDYTWSGATPTDMAGAGNWSRAGNWQGGTPPGGSVGTVSFPAMSINSACMADPSNGATARTCYLGTDDIEGLAANALSIDDGVGYRIDAVPQTFRSGLTIGAGGITAGTSAAAGAASGTATLFVPLVLGASQAWTIDGGSAHIGGLYVDTLRGAGSALAVDLANGATLGLSEAEVGPITVTGRDATQTGVNAADNGVVAASGFQAGYFNSVAAINTSDGNPISLVRASLRSSGGSWGPLGFTGGSLDTAAPGSTIFVAGDVTFDSASAVSLHFGEDFRFPHGSQSYSGLNATGNVDLGSAALRMGWDCLTPLPVGAVYPIVSGGGSLSGTFAGVPDGSVVSLSTNNCAAASPKMRIDYRAATAPTVRVNYTRNRVNATVLTPGRSTIATAGRVHVVGGVASVTVTCIRTYGQSCRVELKLALRRTVILGSATATLFDGQSKAAHVKLNAAGRRLLSRRHRLTVQLVVTGGGLTLTNQTVVFRASGRNRLAQPLGGP